MIVEHEKAAEAAELHEALLEQAWRRSGRRYSPAWAALGRRTTSAGTG